MKETARILRFKGKDLRTAAEITAAEEALMADLMAGEITATESRRIQMELTRRIKAISSAEKTAGQLMTLKEMAEGLEQAEHRRQNRRPR